MNREIKFRIWYEDTKEMMPVHTMYSSEDVKRDLLDNSPFDFSKYEPDEILMQYTGLKDMNGTEIYEGDLLRHPPKDGFDKNNYILFEVFYHDNDCADCHIGWQMNRMHYHGSSCGGFTPAFLPKNVKSMVVVGNVLQNKELLK